MNTKFAVFLAAAIIAFAAVDTFGQARWSGGDGNWTDANWIGGTGPNGNPDTGQNVTLPNTTGGVVINTDLNDAVAEFGELLQDGGTLTIEPAGRADFAGNVRIANAAGTTAALIVTGELNALAGLDVGFGGFGTLAIEGSAQVFVGANLDTWWADGAQMVVTGDGADIEIGGTYYLGTAATLTANINSANFSTITAPGNVNFPGGNGTLEVNFVDGFEPQIGTSWTLFDSPTVGGQIPIVNTPDFGPGTLLSVNYGEGGEYGQVVTLDFINTLNLRVNTTTGEAVLENPIVGGENLDIDGYIIRSTSDSLLKDGLTGIGQPGWLPGLEPSQSVALLSETDFNGSTVVAQGQSYPLGALFNTAGSQDLTLEYHLAGGRTLPGTVQFVGGLEGDYNSNGELDAGDLDLQAVAITGGQNPIEFDLNDDTLVNFDDRKVWVNDLKNTWIGDANLDFEFNSSDMVQVFVQGKYETGENAGWQDGDWGGDTEFDSSDMVAAFAAGGYELGAKPAVTAVPEPASWILVLLGLAACGWRRRR